MMLCMAAEMSVVIIVLSIWVTAVAAQDFLPTPTAIQQPSVTSECGGCVAYVPILVGVYGDQSTSAALSFVSNLGTFSFDHSRNILGDDLTSVTAAVTLDDTVPSRAVFYLPIHTVATRIMIGSQCSTKLVSAGHENLWDHGASVFTVSLEPNGAQTIGPELLLSQARQIQTAFATLANLDVACKSASQTTLVTTASLNPRSNLSVSATGTVSTGNNLTAPILLPTSGSEPEPDVKSAVAIGIGVTFGGVFLLWLILYIGLLRLRRRRYASEMRQAAGRRHSSELRYEAEIRPLNVENLTQIDSEKPDSVAVNRSRTLTLGSGVDHQQITKAVTWAPIDKGIREKDASGALPLQQYSGSTAYGIRLVHEPEGDADCNIIAIHGIFGDAIKTWTHKNGVSWLGDLLPVTMPRARFWSYGYRTRVTAGASYNAQGDAQELLKHLLVWKNYDPQHSRLPLMFVCHNTGGLVLAQAVVSSALEHNIELSSVIQPLQGIVFLGTPFNHSAVFSHSWSSYLISKLFSHSWIDDSGYLKLELTKSNHWNSDLKVQFLRVAPQCVVTFYDTEKPLFGSPVVSRPQCILGLAQELILPASKLAFDATIDSIDNVDYISLSEAVYSCAYNLPYGQNFIQSERIAPYILTNSSENAPQVAGNARVPLDTVSPVDLLAPLSDEPLVASPIVTDAGTSNVIAQSIDEILSSTLDATNPSQALPLPFQFTLGGAATGGVVVGAVYGGVQLHSSRITARATMKSAIAAEVNSKVAVSKLLLDMRKELRSEIIAHGEDIELNNSARPKSHNMTSVKSGTASEAGPSLIKHTTRPVITAKELENIKYIRTELDRSAAARRSTVVNHRRTEVSSVDEQKLAGRLHSLLSKALRSEEKPEESRKGKERAFDVQEGPLCMLEFDPVEFEEAVTTYLSTHDGFEDPSNKVHGVDKLQNQGITSIEGNIERHLLPNRPTDRPLPKPHEASLGPDLGKMHTIDLTGNVLSSNDTVPSGSSNEFGLVGLFEDLSEPSRTEFRLSFDKKAKSSIELQKLDVSKDLAEMIVKDNTQSHLLPIARLSHELRREVLSQASANTVLDSTSSNSIVQKAVSELSIKQCEADKSGDLTKTLPVETLIDMSEHESTTQQHACEKAMTDVPINKLDSNIAMKTDHKSIDDQFSIPLSSLQHGSRGLSQDSVIHAHIHHDNRDVKFSGFVIDIETIASEPKSQNSLLEKSLSSRASIIKVDNIHSRDVPSTSTNTGLSVV